MEIYSIELELGEMKIEVSVKDTSPRIRFDDFTIDYSAPEKAFNVYLTAKDKDGRRIWHTPIIDEEGQPKKYHSIEDAIQDVTVRFSEVTRK